MIRMFVGFTPKSDELIEDFPVEFPSSIKDQESNGVQYQVGFCGDEIDGHKVPIHVHIHAILWPFPKKSGVPPFHVLQSTEGNEES